MQSKVLYVAQGQSVCSLSADEITKCLAKEGGLMRPGPAHLTEHAQSAGLVTSICFLRSVFDVWVHKREGKKVNKCHYFNLVFLVLQKSLVERKSAISSLYLFI